MKMTPIRKSARDQACTVQLHPYCNGNPETTVLAHLRCEDHGIAYKSPDHWAVYACSTCHDIIDGRVLADELSQEEIDACVVRGLYRTQKQLIELGLITVKGVA